MKQLFTIALLALATGAGAQRTDNPWQVDVSAGLHSFYLPAQGLRFERPELVAQAAVSKPLGPVQRFSVGLQFGFARNNYQGDAVYLQLLAQYTPVIAKKVELGFGTGIGYRLGKYPSTPLHWTGSSWTKGKGTKGVLQVPLQVTAGYRSLHINHVEVRPYAGVQVQGLFGYAPDLSILPVTNLLVGLKIQKP